MAQGHNESAKMIAIQKETEEKRQVSAIICSDRFPKSLLNDLIIKLGNNHQLAVPVVDTVEPTCEQAGRDFGPSEIKLIIFVDGLETLCH